MNSNPSLRKAYYVLLLVSAAFLLQPKDGTWAYLHDMRWLYILILSFVLAQIFTPLVIRIAHYFKILDYPDAGRKLHAAPTARIGGLAIFIAVLLSTTRNYRFSPELTGLMIGSSIIYVLGFIDDIRPLKATPRLMFQILAAVIVVKSGVIITLFDVTNPWWKFADALITIMWLIGMANAINFLDGVDGLATSMVALSALLFFLIAWPTRQSYLSYLTIALAGSCLGFLPYNWKRATVFLGDAGATFMGFLLAGLAVMGSWAYQNPTVALSTPLLILAIPIFDMIYTTISRVHNGTVRSFRQWLEYAGRDHFHHRLMHLRLSEVSTVLFILLVNLCLGLGALVIRDTGTKGSILLLTQSFIIFIIIVVLMIMGKDRRVNAGAERKAETDRRAGDIDPLPTE